MFTSSAFQLPYLSLNAVKECGNPTEEETPMLIRSHSSLLKCRGDRPTPTFQSLKPIPCQLYNENSEDSDELCEKVALKSWNLPHKPE